MGFMLAIGHKGTVEGVRRRLEDTERGEERAESSEESGVGGGRAEKQRKKRSELTQSVTD